MQCPRCNSESFTKLAFELGASDEIEFYSCRSCEERWWQRGDRTIVLDDVFTLPERVRQRRIDLAEEERSRKRGPG
jgi:transcription elongation factor Elf1